MAAPSGDDPAGFSECAGLTTIRRSCARRSRKCLGYLAQRDAEGDGRILVGNESAAVSHHDLTTALTTTMTTVGLPDTSSYTTTELASSPVEPSACAYGSEGLGPIGDHTLRAVMNHLRVYARLAWPQTDRALAVTSGNALPRFTGGQVVAGSNPVSPTKRSRL